MTDAEWLTEKLNSVKDESTPEYTVEMCQDIIRRTLRWPGVASWRLLLSDILKITELSRDDKDRVLLIAEDFYDFAMNYHKDPRNRNGEWRNNNGRRKLYC